MSVPSRRLQTLMPSTLTSSIRCNTTGRNDNVGCRLAEDVLDIPLKYQYQSSTSHIPDCPPNNPGRCSFVLELLRTIGKTASVMSRGCSRHMAGLYDFGILYKNKDFMLG